MKLSVTAGGFALYKESDIIGQCSVTPAPCLLYTSPSPRD